jgi:hypothetical protein
MQIRSDNLIRQVIRFVFLDYILCEIFSLVMGTKGGH